MVETDFNPFPPGINLVEKAGNFFLVLFRVRRFSPLGIFGVFLDAFVRFFIWRPGFLFLKLCAFFGVSSFLAYHIAPPTISGYSPGRVPCRKWFPDSSAPHGDRGFNEFPYYRSIIFEFCHICIMRLGSGVLLNFVVNTLIFLVFGLVLSA